jgi:hypothetical protein
MKIILTIIIFLISLNGFTQNTDIEGKYIIEHSYDFLDLKHDSSFLYKEYKGSLGSELAGGKWRLTNDTLKLEVVYDYLCFLDTSFIQIKDKKIPIVYKSFEKSYSTDKKIDTVYANDDQQYLSIWISDNCPDKLLVKKKKLIVICDLLKAKRHKIVFIREIRPK